MPSEVKQWVFVKKTNKQTKQTNPYLKLYTSGLTYNIAPLLLYQNPPTFFFKMSHFRLLIRTAVLFRSIVCASKLVKSDLNLRYAYVTRLTPYFGSEVTFPPELDSRERTQGRSRKPYSLYSFKYGYIYFFFTKTHHFTSEGIY